LKNVWVEMNNFFRFFVNPQSRWSIEKI
jgi:hypothetical protein